MSSIRGYEHDMFMLEKEKVRALVNIVTLLDRMDRRLETIEEYNRIRINEKTKEELRHNYRHDLNDEGANI
jgi:hypothetical protein